MPDHAEKIAEIEELLNSGSTSRGVDGLTESTDLGVLQRRLAKLKREHDGDPNTSPSVNRGRRMIPYDFRE